MSLGAQAVRMGMMAIPVFWVVLLFLILLSLDDLFREDWQSGVVEQYLFTPDAFIIVLYIQLIAFCLRILIPVTLLIPFLSVALYFSSTILMPLMISLWLSAPTLIFLGAIARALTISLPQSIFLVMLILFPLYIPVLIFASSAVILANEGLSPNASFAWLAALLLLSISFSPWIIRKVFQWSVLLL
jgi:heme exporter protein B